MKILPLPSLPPVTTYNLASAVIKPLMTFCTRATKNEVLLSFLRKLDSEDVTKILTPSELLVTKRQQCLAVSDRVSGHIADCVYSAAVGIWALSGIKPTTLSFVFCLRLMIQTFTSLPLLKKRDPVFNVHIKSYIKLRASLSSPFSSFFPLTYYHNYTFIRVCKLTFVSVAGEAVRSRERDLLHVIRRQGVLHGKS